MRSERGGCQTQLGLPGGCGHQLSELPSRELRKQGARKGKGQGGTCELCTGVVRARRGLRRACRGGRLRSPAAAALACVLLVPVASGVLRYVSCYAPSLHELAGTAPLPGHYYTKGLFFAVRHTVLLLPLLPSAAQPRLTCCQHGSPWWLLFPVQPVRARRSSLHASCCTYCALSTALC